MTEKLTVKTPVGAVTICTEGGAVTALRFSDEGGEAQNELLREAAGQLSEYLQGRRTGFFLPLRLPEMTSFRRDVLLETARIPYGETMSYGRLSSIAGGSPRAVGGALGSNPLPIFIPCHRVVRSDGSLGGFTGAGTELKASLLRLEALHRAACGEVPDGDA